MSEEAKEQIRALVKNGNLTEEQGEELLSKLALSPSMQALVEMAHMSFCQSMHITSEGLGEAECNYHAEEEFEDTWNLRDHIKWTIRTKELMTRFEIKETTELRNIFYCVLEARGLVYDKPVGLSLLKSLLDLEGSELVPELAIWLEEDRRLSE